MQAILWRDYVCPWCYLGRDRTRLLDDLGVTVTHRAFELHPEIPSHGVAVRPNGRLAATLAGIAAECASVGLPFVVPTRLPSSRRALETIEIVRARHPDAFGSLDDALFEAVFVHGLDIAEPTVLHGLVQQAGVDADAVRGHVEDGEGAELLAASMASARENGVAATPAWLVDSSLLVPGVQPRDVLTRWIERMHARRSS